MRLPTTIGLPLESPREASHARVEQAARGLETQFAQMLIKSMRSASMGDPMLGDNTTYREMYDQQLARELGKGRGLGLAPMIVRQLERSNPPSAGAPLTVTPPPLPLQRPPVGALPLAPALRAVPLTLAPSSHGVSLPAVAAPAVPAHAADPVAARACDGEGPLDCSSPEAFVRSLWPQAQKVAAQLGVSARALVAQAALETGWGRRLVGAGKQVASHNLFGIKAGARWGGAQVSAGTHEFVDGVRVQQRAQFRAYGSAADSFADYARLLGNARYAAVRGTGEDAHRFASALQQAGYATDPSYAAKIAAIADGPTLRRALASLSGAGSIDHLAIASADQPAPDHKG
jgi:flagellar protein FlgJ